MAETIFGLKAEAAPLPSERDQNFRLTTTHGERFVLKLAQAGEDRALLECQNEVLERLHAASTSYRFPRLRAATSGSVLVSARDEHGAEHWTRLVEYLPGQPLATVRPHSPDLLREVGVLFGMLDSQLQGFEHAAAARELQWDLRKATDVIARYIAELDDPARRARVQSILSLLERSKPLLTSLRQSVIHNDGNDYNIIVDPPSLLAPFRPTRVVGLIDFGDLLCSWTIAEVAIAATYCMLGKADPLAAAAHVIAGYHAAFPIPEREIEAIFPLIIGRLGLSVTLAAVQRKAQPDNEYLSISEAPAWALLEQLDAVHVNHAHYRFRDACGLEPVPPDRGLRIADRELGTEDQGSGIGDQGGSKSATVTAWLTDNGSRAANVLPDVDLSRALVLDFSVGSLEFGDVAGVADVNVWSAAIFGRLAVEGATAGIGRYDEARPWYTAPAFQSASDGGPDWRTFHLGIDLFAEAGTAVAAPFDGVVHSFRDNAGPLDYGPTIIVQHDVSPGLTFYTLYGHLSRESLAGLKEGALVKAGDRIATLGAATVNGGWAPHLHFQIITDLLGRKGEFPGVARPSERELFLSISPDPNLVLRLPQVAPAPRISDLLPERHARIGPSLSIAYRKPLTIRRGWMQHLFDANGQPYLDAVNNVAHVGHCHPHVTDALARQAAVLNTNTRYLHDNILRYAERLCATLPEPLTVCYFVCSGSEANELALRLARAHSNAHDVIVLDGAYHGNTTALIELSPYKFNGKGGAGRPDHVQVVPLPDSYRGRYRGSAAATGQRYADEVHSAIDRIRARGQRLAAFFAEPLPGCGGQIVLPDGYLAGAFAHVRAAGGVCVVDEVQTALGRVGSHFWAFETQGVVPDIVTIGKPIGNGHPLGAVITTPAIAASFANGMEYFNTFGGNPVSCAVGMAVLDVIEDEALQQNALQVGTHLLNRLSDVSTRHPIVGDVRGRGLYTGVELVLDRELRTPAGDCASYVANRMRERGILISTDGPDHNVLKIKPPLVFTAQDADRLADTLDEVLRENAVGG
ncbi:MAG: aminotransferase class III-fold pyridoxal phosphate-dependent enzyme [Gemmatimonadota bacterium]